jgi:hypothetical protein
VVGLLKASLTESLKMSDYSSIFAALEASAARVMPAGTRKLQIGEGLTDFTHRPSQQMLMVGTQLGEGQQGKKVVLIATLLPTGVQCLNLNDAKDRMRLEDGREVPVRYTDYQVHGPRKMVTYTVEPGGSRAGGRAGAWPGRAAAPGGGRVPVCEARVSCCDGQDKKIKQGLRWPYLSRVRASGMCLA